MPVNATRVTTLGVHALPIPPQSFSAKAEAQVLTQFQLPHRFRTMIQALRMLVITLGAA